MRQAMMAVAVELRPVVSRSADWLALGKPRLLALVLFVVAAGAVLAPGGPPSLAMMGALVLGTALVAGSASAANQCLERDLDARMPRTATRPLVTGALSPSSVWAAALVSLVGGVVLLGSFSPRSALTALGSWVVYVLLYTPLKRRTTLNTAVGAVAGALPALIGWVATSPVTLEGWALFTLVYLWQFPHFMAIAWLYREQYAAVGMRMLPVVEPSGRVAGLQSLLAAGLLIPVSLLVSRPLGLPRPILYAVVALGALQALGAWHFALGPEDGRARRLLHASLIYLPGVLGLMLWGTFPWP